MDLVGSRVRLRPLQKQDLTKMALWNCDAEVQRFVDCTLPGSLIDLERWFDQNVPDRNYQIFAIENLQGELIGDLEMDHICWHRREGELRIRIGEKAFWSQGYGTEAIRIMLEYYMGEKDFKRIYLKVYDFNLRAIRCYQKNGFKQVGVLQRAKAQWKAIVLMEVTQTKYRRWSKTTLAG